MGQKFFNPRSAYGQLILLIFLPIFFLSMVGGLMVYLETMHANRHEQQVLAKAILIRYQPIIKAQLPIILEQPNEESDNSNHLTNNQLQNLLFSVQTESELQRIAIINDEGEVLQSAGFKTLHSWRNIKPKNIKNEQASNGKNQFIFNVKTDVGTAYGISFGNLDINGKNQSLWLFVDMDNQPLKIAQYRIALALAITGLLTLLLLLLSLNIYSRRWIEPLYQLRLYLQGVNIDNLTKPLEMYGHGELSHLKEDLITSLKRVDDSFQELKAHTEQTENDLRQAFDEMEMQNISIRTARDRAVSTSEAKSAFLANISHELRTPLNSIDGFINLLARHGKLSAEQDLYVQTIRKSSAHLLALVNDVLDFSKIEAGKLVLDNHQFDLYDAIYDVVDMLSPVASEKGLRLAVLFYNDVPLSIMGDALRVKQVLTNLVANAIKFTDTGSILVKVALHDSEDNQLLISVQDTGRGVSEENQRLLFRNFTQGDPSITRQYGGTGLGLVISKQLTLLMGGKIGYHDNIKQNIASTGSTFYFSVPAHVDVLEVENASDISLPMLSDTPQDSEKRLQILLWINHADSVRVLKASLQPLPIDITETHSLVSTLDILKEEGNKWDWVIVDSDTNSTSTETDNMTALLKQLRLHYQGKLAVYGYQIALDNALLARYKVAPLHEPIDKRQLYRMLDKRKQSDNKEKTNIQKWKGYRVLAVDDHMPNLLVLDALLMEQGIEVVTANSGFDAIEIISKQSAETAENKIDLIFMDIQMPRMSGHQASEQIRNIDNNEPPIPIIALTAHGMLDERDKLIKSGIDDYVSKPISQPQLLQILQKWLGKKSLEVEENISEETPTENAENSINAEELLVIDWEDALSRSANKPDLSARLIMMMIDSIAEEKQALINAWQTEDSEKLAQISHRILGASRYTGVPQLRHASETLEKECLAHKEQNQQDINLLANHYKNLLQSLDNLANIDLSPWPQLRYHKFDEDDMTWKMI